jgi:type I restriction enzyme M protein
MRPTPMMRISDPACGTGGFLLAAFEYLKARTEGTRELNHLKTRSLHGIDLVPNVARLCAMNLFLHELGTDPRYPPISIGDSLEIRGESVDMVLTNPPFGKKSSFIIVGADGRNQTEKISYERPDFWATTSNKQLNFVQHIHSMLKEDGRAAVVVPDNVLFESGAGETIRRALLKKCDVHTLLRLPIGIWYSPGVKANVLFFDKKPKATNAATKEVWVYDLRSNQRFSLKNRQIGLEDLADFVSCYCAEDRGQRKETKDFRRVKYSEIVKRDKANLNIEWQHESANQPPNESKVLLREILDDLEEAMKQFAKVESGILG